jgi:hypothetical protein
VAELVLDDLQVGPARQGEGGGTVPQAVQGNRRQPRPGDQPPEQAGHPVRADGPAGSAGEHVSGLGPPGPGGGTLVPLPEPVLAQRRDRGLVERDDPLPGIALRQCYGQPAAELLQLPRQVERPGL